MRKARPDHLDPALTARAQADRIRSAPCFARPGSKGDSPASARIRDVTPWRRAHRVDKGGASRDGRKIILAAKP